MHHAGVRFARHVDGVKYGQFFWSDIKRDEAGIHIPGQPKPQRVTFCTDDRRKDGTFYNELQTITLRQRTWFFFIRPPS